MFSSFAIFIVVVSKDKLNVNVREHITKYLKHFRVWKICAISLGHQLETKILKLGKKRSYSEFLRSEYGKIWTRKTPKRDNFHAV